jgi:hypothetical protein
MAYRGEWRPFLERLASDLMETQPVRGAIDRASNRFPKSRCERAVGKAVVRVDALHLVAFKNHGES